MTKLGEYRHKIWADEPVATQDEDTGEEVVEFVPRERVSCKIEPFDGREALRADQILADADTRIVVPWSSFAATITAKWRLRFVRTGTSVIYNIARPPAERLMGMREIEFVCSSGLNDG
jgi:SPP1 family predicted phage head-tail adaptor